jgi:ATP-dependent RNA helicase SUPV3L1/SUV3
VSTLKNHDTQALDALTGGVFSAPTSGERAARVREWLSNDPNAEQMQEVFRELSARDKGAARLLREKLDEIKRAKGQEAIAAEWAEKAQSLLSQPRLNIADAMAWQRDAAKAGAPLSREPLAGVKTQLGDRIRGIEDLQNRVQVQREAAVLLAQRIEVLSTKSWKDAEAAAEALRTDVPQWESQAQLLLDDPNWGSVDPKFPPLLEASRSQLQVVWDAFQSALAQATAASRDANAPLPPVPVWSDELRQSRGHAPESAPAKPAKSKVDPELRAKANHVISEALAKLEQEVGQGHGKASAGAANALRNALKEHGKLVDDKLEAHAHAALGAATELEGWQRWRADQLRQELVAKAEALFETVPTKGPAAAMPSAEQAAAAPVSVPAPEGEPASPNQAEGGAAPEAADSGTEPVAASATPMLRKPRYGGRKMQETLRSLREQWKQVDQGGPPNHALWKRFDEACNEAYKVVQEWLDKVKAEAAEHRSARLALIEEVKAWATGHPEAPQGDWKAFNRALHQFSDRWRDAGHLSEKAFAELQPQWKEAIGHAAGPLERAQKASIDRRNAMIEEARVLGEAPMLRIDAVKSLQQRWQAEAQTVPLDRKQEQKLWDAFRKPIDDAFNRKTVEREKAAAAMSGRDRAVLEASKAVEEATASGDAQKIRAAMVALEQALQARDDAAATAAAAGAPAATPAETLPAAASQENGGSESAGSAAEVVAGEQAAPAAAAPPKPAPKPVVAMRSGDDRPGGRRADTAAAARGGRFDPRRPGAGGRDARDDRRGGGFRGDRDDRREDRGPRLGDAAFRAQREALEHAQAALRKLAAQAHGEALSQLMAAWEQRSSEQVPSHQELGKVVSTQVRQAWTQALGKPPAGDASEVLLRLEIAADVPTPADQIAARRQFQLQLLTRRNEPGPQETWGMDVAKVLATGFEANAARRLQNALKALLRR